MTFDIVLLSFGVTWELTLLLLLELPLLLLLLLVLPNDDKEVVPDKGGALVVDEPPPHSVDNKNNMVNEFRMFTISTMLRTRFSRSCSTRICTKKSGEMVRKEAEKNGTKTYVSNGFTSTPTPHDFFLSFVSLVPFPWSLGTCDNLFFVR